jgi:type IV secretory pathway VirB2 component (pilin)
VPRGPDDEESDAMPANNEVNPRVESCLNGCGCLVIAVIAVILFIGQMVLFGALFWHFLGW